MVRKKKVVLLFLALAVNVAILVYFSQRRARPLPDRPNLESNSLVVQQKRIKERIASVGSESDQVLVDHLINTEMYFHPGFHSPYKGSQNCLEIMLSNRRCLRLLSMLESLPKGEVDTKCMEIFDKVLGEHLATLERIFRMYEDPSAPQNTQALDGTRGAICAAMFCKCLLAQPRVVLDQFGKLDSFRKQIDLRLEVPGKWPSDLDVMVRTMYLPDNRFMLNTLILAAKSGPRADAVCGTAMKKHLAHVESQLVEVVAWNAETTPYDLTRRYKGIEVDRSLGVRELEVFRWVPDYLFDLKGQSEMVDRIRQALTKCIEEKNGTSGR